MRNILYLLFLIFVLYSCDNNTYTEKDYDKNKLRIVSLVPSVTDELISLGMTENIVGTTSFCDISATKKELVVGTATDVNIEKVLLLKPDIVFVSGLTKENTSKTLTSNGITVHRFGKMHSYKDICDHLLELGSLVGKKELAGHMVSASLKKVDSLRKSIPEQKDTMTIFFQIGAKPIFTVIPNSFMDDYITMAKCINIATDINSGIISRESILQRNPDIIFIVTMGLVGDDEQKIWESYQELSASKNKRIYVIDAKLASMPTVQSFTKSLEHIIKQIY